MPNTSIYIPKHQGSVAIDAYIKIKEKGNDVYYLVYKNTFDTNKSDEDLFIPLADNIKYVHIKNSDIKYKLVNVKNIINKIDNKIKNSTYSNKNDELTYLGIGEDNNFLYIRARCLHPIIVQSSNIKVQKEEFSVLYNKLLKKKFYFSQMVIWTIYFILLITVFGGLAIYDIIHWESDAYMAGFNKFSALFLGVFPPLIMILFSYFFCIVNLVKQYNNNYLCE